MTTYRLGSNEMLYAPGLIRWAINGYHFKLDRKQLRKVITKGWGIPETAAEALLSGAVPFTVEGKEDMEAVVFTVEGGKQ